MASTRVLSGLPPIFVYKTDAWVSLCDGGICEGVEFGLACLANSRVMLRGITIIYQPHVRLLQIGRKRCLFANEAADEAMGNKSVDGDSCVGDVYSNDGQANIVVAQLLHLAYEDPKADISLYINSPGGSVYDGMAIYDTMNFIAPDVATYGIGLQASMGAFLLSSGAKGKRFALPHAKVMIHQPSSGTRGKVTDMEIDLKESLGIKDLLAKILAKNTGQKLAKVKADMERDYWMTAEEAKKYGLVDQVLEKIK